LGQFSKNYRTFYQKNCQKALKNMVLGSGIRKKPIPDPGVKKHRIPDPGPATLLLPIGWMIVQILRQRRRKTTNTELTTLSGIQSSSQSTYINFYPLVIGRNDKNIQLTLLSQRKLALTLINKHLAL
jgi:hypothetical protein